MQTNIIKWAATVLTIAGAICTSLNMFPINAWLFNIGGLFWLWFAIKIRESSLIVVNAALLLIYSVGVLHNIFS